MAFGRRAPMQEGASQKCEASPAAIRGVKEIAVVYAFSIDAQRTSVLAAKPVTTKEGT
jgi:hypothetical protein